MMAPQRTAGDCQRAHTIFTHVAKGHHASDEPIVCERYHVIHVSYPRHIRKRLPKPDDDKKATGKQPSPFLVFCASPEANGRSEERRVGKECRARGTAYEMPK